MNASSRQFPRFSRYIKLTLLAFVAFAVSFVAYVYSEKQIDRANEIRAQTDKLADELHQSSDDLTRMVRSYVATSNPIYKQHFQDILAIRDGKKPRPLNYGNDYWDPKLQNPPPALGPAVPLLTLIEQAGFTPDEQALLSQAKSSSDKLTRTEWAAMQLLESTQPHNDQNRLRASAMLHDAAYERAKAEIMAPISEFHDRSELRTVAAVRQAENRAKQLRITFVLFGLLLLVMLSRAIRHLRNILGDSVLNLHERIERLGCGDFSTPIPVKPGMENSVLAWLAETQNSLANIDKQHKEAEARNHRLTQLYAALSQCNQAIVRCNNETDLFAQICDVVVTHGGLKMAWVGVLAADQHYIKPVASFGSGTEYLDQLVVSIKGDEANGCGPMGTAYRTDTPVWLQDFQHDSRCLPWREQSILYGWSSSAAIPLHRNGNIVAIFALYAEQTAAFNQDIQNLLVEMASDIDYALKIMDQEAERIKAEKQIQYLAHFDSLTALPNRTQLNDRAKYALSLAQRNATQLTVMCLDLDHFKDINDTLGHSIGDTMLVELARRLQAAMRAEDSISRLGGDEFIFLLHNVDAHGAALVAQKILSVITAPYQIDSYDLNVTGSIGIAMYPDDGNDLETLLKRADAAMYRAKKSGRDAYCFYTAEMQAHSARHLQLVNGLRQALDRQQFLVHYQPQIDTYSEQVIGAEALLRWTHPELGAVSPAEFIPAAEDCGLILPIGEWVLRESVRQAKEWISKGMKPMVMAVNLSAIQFRHPDLPALVSRILAEEGLPPEYLELELTEGVTMQDPQAAIATMNDLHDRGIRMSIDDFGTGYSSLNHLKKFKVYKLKIDQSFVRDISTDPEDKAIVGAVIQMAQHLGLLTIAEGVETTGQLAFLREQGCDEIQGYYYSKPLGADAFEVFVAEHAHKGSLL